MIFKKSIANIGNETFTVVKFNVNNTKDIEVKAAGKTILYFSRQDLSLDRDCMKISVSTNTFNRLYIISTGNDDFDFQINERVHHCSKIKGKITEKQLQDLLYTLAYEEYRKGNSKLSMEILSTSLMDKYLIKTVLNSFTVKERKRCEDILLTAAHNRKLKVGPKTWMTSRLAEGVLMEEEVLEEGICLIELLEVFEKNKDKFIPLSKDRYRRIGKKVVDNYNAFKADKSTNLTADFADLVFTKEKLNISIRYKILGNVIINPRQAKKVGLNTNVFEAKVFREQTIIKDGELNIDKFKALLSKGTLHFLQGVRDIYRPLNNSEYTYPNYTLVELDISKLPVLNRNYISKYDSLEYILDTTYVQRSAECRQKVLKYFLEKASKTVFHTKSTFTKEQLELLETYGLDDRGIYHGIDNKVISEPEAEQNEYRVFEFSLKGFSTLPKVEVVIKKLENINKKLNGPETIMSNYIKYLVGRGCLGKTVELGKLLEKQKAIIREATRTLALIKLSKALTGGWWQGLKLYGKDNFIYESKDKSLVIKTVKKVERK